MVPDMGGLTLWDTYWRGADVFGKHIRPSDLAGASRIAGDSMSLLTSLIESVHASADPTARGSHIRDLTAFVYAAVRSTGARVAETSAALFEALAPQITEVESSRQRDAFLSAINGVLGDRLAETSNPLAIPMDLRRYGRPAVVDQALLEEQLRQNGGDLLVFVHGLCLNDHSWERQGQDYARAFWNDLGYSSVCVRYNTGLHVSTNGRNLARQLESFLADLSAPVRNITLLGHSMGGLVARSACHYGLLAGHAWPQRLRNLIFLGTPHHGALLERLGNWIQGVLEALPYTGPFAKLGEVRSAGITDLRHGSILDEDWQERARFAQGDTRTIPLLPEWVACFAIAGLAGNWATQELGDGLVAVRSALGRHRDPKRDLGIPENRCCVVDGTHLALLDSPVAYRQLVNWLKPAL